MEIANFFIIVMSMNDYGEMFDELIKSHSTSRTGDSYEGSGAGII